LSKLVERVKAMLIGVNFHLDDDGIPALMKAYQDRFIPWNQIVAFSTPTHEWLTFRDELMLSVIIDPTERHTAQKVFFKLLIAAAEMRYIPQTAEQYKAWLKTKQMFGCARGRRGLDLNYLRVISRPLDEEIDLYH